MDIHMEKDGNNSYVYDLSKKETSQNNSYDGRFNAINNNVKKQDTYDKKILSKNLRKIESNSKSTAIKNNEQEIQYKRIDIWV